MIFRYIVDQERSRLLQDGRKGKGPVVYWMSRDQRAHDNWALLFAQERALALERPLMVVFCIDLTYPSANLRHFGFLLRGLQELQMKLADLALPFLILKGDPARTLPVFLEKEDPALLVTDFDPLRIKKRWKESVLHQSNLPIYEVDAHNIVPCWLASDKREYGAYTIRPKIQRLLPRFLTDFPELVKHPYATAIDSENALDIIALLSQIKDRSVEEIKWLKPGEQAAMQVFADFETHRLQSYPADRNNPCLNGQSNLSPYFHFGQLAPQRVAWDIWQSDTDQESKESYLEELIIRRELSDNYCYYTADYDHTNAFPDWARKSLAAHRLDPRPSVADLHILENASTEDELWNGCQRELTGWGKLHGYLRMYWAKKILEWSPSPEAAMANAIFLNDKYSLDGRDPNGYAGIAWSIGGVHDRAWQERPVFGKIRYMNKNGCKRKFNIYEYLQRVNRNTSE
ncbi:MAG: deoxyribodipyrimidine photo-lyase [Desulfocapsaceae bacterium]|nr:deoxyribodipyrimidine photo-lyase [Desulfocapsaceae bacterium]